MGASQGQLFLASGTSMANTVTLSGTGSITMTSSAHDAISGNQPFISTVLVNEWNIQGTGNIENSIILQNASCGVINANVSGNQLIVGRGGASTNTGLMEGTNGGQLVIGSIALNNVGGTIQAVGTGSSLAFESQGQGGQTITGGTLTTSGGGVIYSEQSTTVDGTNGNTVTNTGSIVVPDAGNHPGTVFRELSTIQDQFKCSRQATGSTSPSQTGRSGQRWAVARSPR